MKLVKAMKKLKLWSRKKLKKKKTHLIEHPPPPPPPPPLCHCCHSWVPVPVQPSAPPLPPWFEYDPIGNSISASAAGPDSGIASSSQSEFNQEEIVPELNSLSNTSFSYQQYMVPNPVYGVPVVPAFRREKKAGFFGCVGNIGRHFIRCFFPCFHIREVD